MKRILTCLKKLIPRRIEYLPAPRIPVIIVQDDGVPIRMYPGDTAELKWATDYRPLPGKKATFTYNGNEIAMGVGETKTITRYTQITYGEIIHNGQERNKPIR